MSAVIYHGTPMTPRAALRDVCAGRAMCVSFYRPDDVEVVEAISPAIMFRQRRILVLAGGYARRTGVGRDAGLDALLRLAGAAPISSREVGNHAGYAGRTIPAQRHAASSVAIRAEGRARLAYGWSYQSAAGALREVQSGLPRVDRPEGWRAWLSGTHGRGRGGAGQSLARVTHAAGNGSGLRLPVRQRRQHKSCAERVAL